MESTTLGGAMKRTAQAAREPACYEGRVSRLDGDRLLVRVRALMGDTKPVVARGWAPRLSTSGDLARVLPERDDPVWVAKDEGGQLVVVAWEPA